MLLAVDVGNTHTVLGVYKGAELLHMWRIETNHSQTSDELRVSLHGLFELAGFSRNDITGVVLATVVPALRRLWCKVGSEMMDQEVLCLDQEVAGDLFDGSVYPSSVIGADRIADAVAARTLYGAPVIVLDFGTATNMEVIDKDGRFLGGVIAPGVGSAQLVEPRSRIRANLKSFVLHRTDSLRWGFESVDLVWSDLGSNSTTNGARDNHRERDLGGVEKHEGRDTHRERRLRTHTRHKGELSPSAHIAYGHEHGCNGNVKYHGTFLATAVLGRTPHLH